MNTELIKDLDLDNITHNDFIVACVACLILTHDNKFLLQHRDSHCQRYPNCLGPFGGRMEEGESPKECLLRELHEELRASVDPNEAIFLGACTKSNSDRQELIYNYFWHDKLATISGCYEGSAKLFATKQAILSYPNVMEDVKWMLKNGERMF